MKILLIFNIFLSFLCVQIAFSNTTKHYYPNNTKEFIPRVLSNQDLELYKKALNQKDYFLQELI